MEKLINVTIDRLGNPTISTQGFVGDECTKATAGIEAVLSEGKGVDRTFLPEYYQKQNAGVQQEQVLRRM